MKLLVSFGIRSPHHQTISSPKEPPSRIIYIYNLSKGKVSKRKFLINSIRSSPPMQIKYSKKVASVENTCTQTNDTKPLIYGISIRIFCGYRLIRRTLPG